MLIVDRSGGELSWSLRSRLTLNIQNNPQVRPLNLNFDTKTGSLPAALQTRIRKILARLTNSFGNGSVEFFTGAWTAWNDPL